MFTAVADVIVVVAVAAAATTAAQCWVMRRRFGETGRVFGIIRGVRERAKFMRGTVTMTHGSVSVGLAKDHDTEISMKKHPAGARGGETEIYQVAKPLLRIWMIIRFSQWHV